MTFSQTPLPMRGHHVHVLARTVTYRTSGHTCTRRLDALTFPTQRVMG